MGSGKTTLGKKLARKLAVDFIDLDHYFEEREGKSVPQYFQDHGEEEFRKAERRVLQTGEFPEQAIIATGGGAPCYFDNIDWMNANGTTIYLSLPAAALAARLENASEIRPVLRNYKGPELIKFIEEKLAERSPFYEKAQLRVPGQGLSADRLADIIEEYQRR